MRRMDFFEQTAAAVTWFLGATHPSVTNSYPFHHDIDSWLIP